MELVRYLPQRPDPELAEKLLALEETAWPSQEGEVFPAAPQTYCLSLALLDGPLAVSHVALRRAALSHRGEEYRAWGLSEVVTHPAYRGRGLASRLLGEARGFLESQPADLCLFTCHPDRVPFYSRCGWEAAPEALLVGGTREKPFPSGPLGLVTMLRLLSPLAQAHRQDFLQGEIRLELGENQLW